MNANRDGSDGLIADEADEVALEANVWFCALSSFLFVPKKKRKKKEEDYVEYCVDIPLI